MKYCHDCINWNPDAEDTGFCDYEGELPEPLESAEQCPGFESVVEEGAEVAA